ncbi:DNA-binding protein [Saccharata proteae CBS 121410]|uniref:DNA-binding protein n=1 Tax=Saccharata proteae CBS 121410 TaxID=1314787 RepID=A0A6A5YE22_9PEZI|nr:DNA-binding protein [Saccharata proteae CBS 121410]
MPPPPPRPPPQTFNQLVAAFTSFLTVAIHTILHQRSIYPAASFLTARAYNYPVYQSRHPLVCAWITDAVAAVEAELLRSHVERIALVIYSAGAKPLERFVWDVDRFPVVRGDEGDTLFESQSEGAGKAADAPNVDMEEQFRAVLAKLTVCASLLKPLPDDCTFTIAIEEKQEAEPPIGHPQPWIPVQPSLQTKKAKDGDDATRGEDVGGSKTTPLRAVDSDEMAFEMWIEEGKAKSETTKDSSGSSQSV